MKIDFNSPVVLTFSVACTAVYVLNVTTAGAFVPLFSQSGYFNFMNPFDYLTMFTYVIGHDFTSMDHLIGNLTFLLLIGPILEEKYGSKALLMMMMVTALVTGVINVVLFDTGIIGASGIVFMYIILVSFTNMKSGHIPLTFIIVAALFLGKEFIASMNQDNISQFAHIMGGIAGSVFGFSKLGKKLSA